MRFGVVVFPGTNCDADCYHVIKDVLHQPVEYIWHRDIQLGKFDCVVLPGGFSYGDYLRAGAIARFAPIMNAVERFAADGGLVLGICNGFQILAEAGLLPGALLPNAGLQFRCEWVTIRVEDTNTPFTCACKPGQVLRTPIAHGEGRYFADPDAIAELEQRGQITFRYCTPGGDLADEANPNGSIGAIAGIRNAAGNVVGLMPHPERCAEAVLGGVDGRRIFESVLRWDQARGRVA